MNEYENALHEAVRVLGLAIIEKGGNRNSIQAGLEEAREVMAENGQESGAATLELLCRALLNPGLAYVPNSN